MLCHEIGLAGALIKLSCNLDAQLYSRTDDYFLFYCTAKKPGVCSLNTVGMVLSLSNC